MGSPAWNPRKIRFGKSPIQGGSITLDHTEPPEGNRGVSPWPHILRSLDKARGETGRQWEIEEGGIPFIPTEFDRMLRIGCQTAPELSYLLETTRPNPEGTMEFDEPRYP